MTTCHAYEIAYKYRYQCVGCGKGVGRHSKSIDVDHARYGCPHKIYEICMGLVREESDGNESLHARHA